MVFEIEVKFDAVSSAQQAELYLVPTIAAMRKGFSRQKSRLVAEAMRMVTKAIDAGVDHELAGQKISGLIFENTLRTHRGGSHKPQLYRETMIPRIVTNNVIRK